MARTKIQPSMLVFDPLAYHGLQVNGFQQISQQNGDTAGTATGYNPADQEGVAANGSFAFSGARVATPFTSRLDIPRAIKIECTTGAALGSGDYVALQQSIEGERLRGRLLWGSSLAVPLRIGRVVRSNVSGRMHVAVTNAANNRSYVTAVDIVADTDTYVTLTIPGDTSGTWAVDNTLGLQITWCLGAGSTYQTTAGAWQAGNYVGASDTTNFMATTGNTVWLGPMVVLPGLELPTFADIMQCQRHYDDELRACQRYYVQFSNVMTFNNALSGASSHFESIELPVDMRVNPSLSVVSQFQYFSSGSYTNFTPTFSFHAPRCVGIIGTGLTNAQGFALAGVGAASARM